MTLYLGTNQIAGGVAVDQIYDGTSTNAQSGVAVAQAIAGVGGVVDQTYDPTSANAQSGTAVAQAISAKIQLVASLPATPEPDVLYVIAES